MPKSISSISLRPTGFSLVELSIVLVILGLLVGGVLSGQSLIHAAQLRTVSTQYQNYAAAVKTFRDKYFAIPGDMTNAASFWGAADGSTGSTAACFSTQGTGTQTCNGNGNGILDWATASNEYFRFWQQLANAGLIEGSYSGIGGAGGPGSSDTTNSPVGKISNSMWAANYQGNIAGTPVLFDGQYGNIFEIGAPKAGNSPYGELFTPTDAWNIDTKMDDGRPATGFIVIQAAALPDCTDAAAGATTDFTANYALSITAPGCAIIFRNQMY